MIKNISLYLLLKMGFGIRTPFDALEKWYSLEPDLFRVNPEEFRNMTYSKIGN
jgi:hypothetical protein